LALQIVHGSAAERLAASEKTKSFYWSGKCKTREGLVPGREGVRLGNSKENLKDSV